MKNSAKSKKWNYSSLWVSLRHTKPDENGKLSSMCHSMCDSMSLTKPHEEGYWGTQNQMSLENYPQCATQCATQWDSQNHMKRAIETLNKRLHLDLSSTLWAEIRSHYEKIFWVHLSLSMTLWPTMWKAKANICNTLAFEFFLKCWPFV